MTAAGDPYASEPEVWCTSGGRTWSYWDMWFALLCVVDHDGDWDGLDKAITGPHRDGSRWDGEAKWSHLLDLRARLDAAGQTAAELVAEVVTHRKAVTRARTKVIKRSLQGRDMTPAMRHPPSRRLEDRGRRGWWPQFPVSPQEPYDELVTRFRLTDLDAYSGDGWAAGELADDVAERARRLETGDPSWNLAVRRALLTIGLDLVESCDDSYGHVGDTVNDALLDYAGTDRSAAHLPPEVFWPDLLEITTLLSNYGLPHRCEVELFERAGAAHALEDITAIVDALHADYRAARMVWAAGQIRGLHVHALVAAGAVDRFETTAAHLGSTDWTALDAMVKAAVRLGRLDVARRTLGAADRPGPHQDLVRRSRAALGG